MEAVLKYSVQIPSEADIDSIAEELESGADAKNIKVHRQAGVIEFSCEQQYAGAASEIAGVPLVPCEESEAEQGERGIYTGLRRGSDLTDGK